MIKVCSIAVATQTVLDCKTTVKDEQIKSGERERGHVTVEQSVPSSHNSQQVVSWSTPTPRHPLMSVYLETLVLYSPNLAHASTLQQQWGRDKEEEEEEVNEWVSEELTIDVACLQLLQPISELVLAALHHVQQLGECVLYMWHNMTGNSCYMLLVKIWKRTIQVIIGLAVW